MEIGRTSLISLAFLMAAITAASWLWFWRRHANPRRRLDAGFAGIGCLLFAAFPGLWVLESMSMGYVPCIWRRCQVDAYSATASPIAFWAAVVLLAALAAFFLGGAIMGFALVFTPGGCQS